MEIKKIEDIETYEEANNKGKNNPRFKHGQRIIEGKSMVEKFQEVLNVQV